MTTRIKILTALSLGSAFLLMAMAPKPKAESVGLALTLAPDSTLHAQVTVALSGPLQTPDAVRYTVYRNDSLQVSTSSKVTDTTFVLGAPAYGITAMYKACGRVFRGTTASGGFKCDSLAYTRPEPPLPPPPTVDGIQISPKVISLSGGETVDFQVTLFTR